HRPDWQGADPRGEGAGASTGADGPGHRAADPVAVQRAPPAGAHRAVERPDGAVRGPCLRSGHEGGGRDHRRAEGCDERGGGGRRGGGGAGVRPREEDVARVDRGWRVAGVPRGQGPARSEGARILSRGRASMTSPRRKPLVAGNWKMHRTGPEAVELIQQLREGFSPGRAEVMVAPPFTALEPGCRALDGSGIALGAQNVHWEPQGAFTGEISVAMLKAAGCTQVIVGHSERRQLFGETDAMVSKKARAALQGGLRPIVCIGETLAE